jgi:hypothetical protein
VKAESRKNKGKGAKREREENGDDSVIEIFSDDDGGGDLEALQVMSTTCHAPQFSDIVPIQGELERIRSQIARKKAKKSVKQEPVTSTDDVIDLT